MTPEPAVVVRSGSRKAKRTGVAAGVPEGWRWIGWFGLVLGVVGMGDFVLTWVPLGVGSPEWEFGTIAASFSGLPLVTMGFAAMLGSALARGVRWQLLGLGFLLVGLAMALVGALVIFLLVVPVALAAVEGAARIGIVKAIVRTLFLGAVFSAAYVAAGIGALRYARRS